MNTHQSSIRLNWPSEPATPKYPQSAIPLAATLRDIHKSFPRKGGVVEALAGVSMDVPAGAFVTVLGPSGSGKSTLLGILAGLDEPDSGVVALAPGGADQPLPSRLGFVGYMPQRDLLLPWHTALDNATVALEVAGVSREEARARAIPLFEEFGLRGFANSLPHQLSGGMRQRVSFLRSALLQRGMMLLDEPFGALDAITRASLQEWLLETLDATTRQSAVAATYVLVTHDVDEAVLLSDRVYILSPRPGRVVGSVDITLSRPRSLDSANDPRFAELRGELLRMLRGAGILPGAGVAS